MEEENVVIEAEKVGLPATATAKEIRDGVYTLAKDRDRWKADAEKWKARAEENQTALIEARKDVASKKEMEGQLLVKSALDARKIYPKDEKFYVELFKTNPEMCRTRLDELEEQRWEERQSSLSGTIGDPPNDPQIELAVAIAHITANNPKLSEAQAAMEAYKRNPGLHARVLEARREAKSKGGVK